MKILFISPLPPPMGGIASWTSNILAYLDRSSLEIKYVICNSAVKGKSITSISTFMRIIFGIFNFIFLFIKIFKTCILEKPNVIHLISSSSYALFKDILIIKFANLINIPIIIHWRFGRIPTLAIEKNWEWKILYYVCNQCNKCIVIDNKSFSTLLEHGISKVINIPNPIPIILEEKAKKVKNILFNKKMLNKIIFVGHVIKNKGVYELVESCQKIPELKELIIIGPYEEIIKEELTEIAKKRDNGTWLKMVGVKNKSQVLNEMENASILVLPSYTEGFPNVIIEAMALGCAIIATPVGAIPDILNLYSVNPCGICIKPQSIADLTSAIRELLNDNYRTLQMGKNGYEKAINTYTMDKIVLQYLQVWKNVLLN